MAPEPSDGWPFLVRPQRSNGKEWIEMRSPQLFRFAALITALTFTLGLLAPVTLQSATAQDAQPVQGGTLQMALGEEPDQLDNARTIELTSNQVMNYFCEWLVYFDTDGLPKPWLAESWEISPDNKTITLKIRQGIKFHDGTALDAAAVAFNYNRIMDPALAAPNLPQLGPIESVTSTDANTIVFTYKEPYAPFFNNAATIQIMSPTAIEQF